MKIGDIVKVNDTTEWNGMYGIIDLIDGDVAFIYCVIRPERLHACHFNDLLKE